jgi:hypothetical protein
LRKSAGGEWQKGARGKVSTVRAYLPTEPARSADTTRSRRGLTAAQPAVVAARALEKMPERRGRPSKGKEKVPEPGTLFRSRDTLAKTFNVGKNAIQQALALLDEAPDIAAQVEARRCTIETGGDSTNYA